MKRTTIIASVLFVTLLINTSSAQMTGSVIFIHPDGTGVSDYNTTRILYYGPDGELNWDRMNSAAVYKGHMKDNLAATSHGGATTHAYGVKVSEKSYGFDDLDTITSLSGRKNMSIMHEAMEKGIKTGLVNSGSVVEPGTGAFVCHSPARRMYELITKQIVESGVDVIMSGGEEWYLPEGTEGRHTNGKRKDGLNLIDLAISLGYYVVYNRDEMLNIPSGTNKVLGIFSEKHTFNDVSEEEQKRRGIRNYKKNVPTIGEMTETAIKILSADGKQFLLISEEEGTDNMANANNANGKMEALKRADDAIGYVMQYIKKNPNTMLITAADSDAGGIQIYGLDKKLTEKYKNGLPERIDGSGKVDGIEGTGTPPFYSAPDKYGNRHPFALVWASDEDMHGSMLAKAHGLNSEKLKPTIDNTDIYRMMYLTLFGKYLK